MRGVITLPVICAIIERNIAYLLYTVKNILQSYWSGHVSIFHI